MTFGGILTAMVTPFGENGDLDEAATAALVRHLLANGSDGLVLAGSTGEGSTLDDEEKLRLWQIGLAEGGGAPIIANTGSNDTRHSVELTQRATELGVDGVLAVTPYYNKPNRRGLIEHFRAIAGATDLPVIVYNIPSRCVIDLPNELLAELAETENIVAVKQSRYEDIEAIEGMDLLAGNDDTLAEVLDAGGTGGILVASNVAATEMRRMIDEPENRQEIHDSLSDLFEALFVTANPTGVKAALEMLGHRVGGLRLPMVPASDEERAVVRSALERHGMLAAGAATGS
ncbi:MAG: 4-hydroxy-tetrahydrodipicolinate synthase [Thermoleophilaceae bacterium]